MPGSSSKCFAPFCRTGYPSERKKAKKLGLPVPSLFSTPSDEETFQIWKRMVPRKDRILHANDKLCELHFEPECVIRDEFFKLPSGEEVKMHRLRPMLIPGSIPTIFPKFSPDTSDELKRKKSRRLQNISAANKRPKKTESEDDSSLDRRGQIKSRSESVITMTIEEEESDSSIDLSSPISIEPSFTKSELLTRIPSIIDDTCSVTEWKECIIILRWTPEFHCVYKVVIKEDFEVEAFKDDAPIPLKINKIEEIDDIRKILKFLDSVQSCPGRKNRFQCRGFLSPSEGICDHCRIEQWCNSNQSELVKK